MYLNRNISLGSGIVLALVGLLMLLFPGFSLSFLAVLVGIGILSVALSALSAWGSMLKGTGTGAVILTLGIVMLVIALVCLFHPLATASAITWLVALLVVIGGIAQLLTFTFAAGMPGRGVGIASTLATIVLGVLALIWPPFIMQFIGVACLVEGISLIVIALLDRPIDVDPQ